MGATISITRRELGAYFNTPIGYVFMIAFLLLSSFLYVKDLFVSGVAEMRVFFEWIPILFMIFIPGIAMRLWSEERKLGTMEVLMTLPVRTWQVVVGKFTAGMLFLIATLLMTSYLPLTLYWLRPEHSPGPDFGVIAGGYLGTLCLGMVFLAVGAFSSSFTGDQIVAFIIGIFINAILLFISFPPFLALLRDIEWIGVRFWGMTLGMHVNGVDLANFVQRLGVFYHFESISRGVVDSRDILYAISMTALFLFLNIMVIERRR